MLRTKCFIFAALKHKDMKTDLLKFNSICAREWDHKSMNEPHVLPIHNSSAFVFENIEQGIEIFKKERPGYVYSRYNNPTLASVAAKLAALESIDFEEEAFGLLTGSGMGAISTTFYACLKQGDTLLTQQDLYGGTTELIQKILKKFGVKILLTDFNDKEQTLQLCRDNNITLIYCESPSNPLISCVDLEFINNLKIEFGMKTAIDNTFASPYIQRPFNYDFDFVIYSTTKFLNGMGNALGGAVICRSEDLFDQVWTILKLSGAYCSPTDAWYLHNGLKTFPLRMERHCDNAMDLASYLEDHPKVAKVNYPGLTSHHSHETASKQMSKYGGMLSFEVKGGMENALKFMNSVSMATLAPTLGNVDTLLLHPASSSHLNVAREIRESVGINDGLIRVSVGIEELEDIINDFGQALDKT